LSPLAKAPGAANRVGLAQQAAIRSMNIARFGMRRNMGLRGLSIFTVARGLKKKKAGRRRPAMEI